MSERDQKMEALWADYADQLREASRGKKIIVVEGEDDQLFLRSYLVHRLGERTVGRRVHVVVADGRSRALRWTAPRKSQVSDPFGFLNDQIVLVDRDVWTFGEAEELCRARPLLFVTPGWCLENLFLEYASSGGLGKEIATALGDSLEAELHIGAFWWVAQRMREQWGPWWNRMGDYGGTPKGIDLTNEEALGLSLSAVSGASFPALTVQLLIEQWSARLGALGSLSTEEKWRQGVHGKSAFRRIVLPKLQTGNEHIYVRLAGELAKEPPEFLERMVALLR